MLKRVMVAALLAGGVAACAATPPPLPPARLEAMARENPDGLKIVSLHCDTARLGNNGADAINACTVVIKMAESDALKGNAFNSRGLIYAHTGRSDAALADFGSAVGLMTDPAPAYGNRADVYRARGRYDLMISDLESARWVRSDDPQSYSARSRMLSVAGDYAAALPLAEKALALGFDEPRGYDALGHALMGLGRTEEAQIAFAEAIERGDANWLRMYQAILARKGYAPGREDGVMDDATQAALKACVRDNCRLLLD